MRVETLSTSIVDLVWSDSQKLGDLTDVLESNVGSEHQMIVFRSHGAGLANQQTRVYERWRLARVQDADMMEKYRCDFLSQPDDQARLEFG